RLHTVRVTIEQGHAEHVLQVCDGPRNGRLRGAELLCRLSHAAGLNDRHEDTQILKLETALDAIGQFHGEAPSYRLRYAVMPKQHFPSMTALHRLVQVSFGRETIPARAGGELSRKVGWSQTLSRNGGSMIDALAKLVGHGG